MLRFDLMRLEQRLLEARLCSRRVSEGEEGWGRKVPILPGITTEGRAWDGPAVAIWLGTKRRNCLWGVKAPQAGGAHRDAATPAKHSKLCFCPKADPVAAPFEKAEPAAPRQPTPGCHGSFCS